MKSLEVYYIKMDYKIIFMANYDEVDVLNDNIDIKIVLSSNKVYSTTFYTASNIMGLIENTFPKYFISEDMIIVKDLSYLSINKVIIDILEKDLMHSCMSMIGTINQVFTKATGFTDIKNYGCPIKGFYR